MDRKKPQKHRKHICLVYEFLSEQGGLEREIITHAHFLKEAGYDVTILTCHLDSKILKLLPFEGLKIKTIGKFNTGIESIDLGLCILGFNKLKECNPDAFLSYSFPVNYLLRNKKTKKINYVNHYPHFLYLKGAEKKEWAEGTQGVKRKIAIVLSWFLENSLRKLDKKLLLRNRLIFMNSEFTKKRLDSLYSLSTGRAIVSYPPLDKRFSMPANATVKEKFIFSSSRIIPDKKYEWLIESASFLKNKLPVYLAGSVEPFYKKNLEDFARRKKVTLNFLGRLTTEKIREYYASASVFAFPTPGEDFGLVPAESLACGTPVVAWNDGAGPTEQIINGVNGYLAKPYNLKDFAARIDQCIESRLKVKNKKKIIASAKKFLYESLKKQFVSEISGALGDKQ